MSRIYTTKTPSLKATIADIRNLDVKKIFVGGENILDIINRATPTIAIKHSQDTRETVTENDLWGQWVETKADGTIIVHDDWVTNPNASSSRAWNISINKVERNKAYTSSGFYANVQTGKIKNGKRMFENCTNLTTFNGDLSSLMSAENMFSSCSQLTSFTSDLSSLMNGNSMFQSCSQLTTFPYDLHNLTTGGSMFSGCTKLTSFNTDLPNLTYGNWMFSGCSQLTIFESDLPSLTDAYSMFASCSNLTRFYSHLSSLMDGLHMFANCNNLTTFASDLSNLTYASCMFEGCTNLTSFNTDLPNLTNGSHMFNHCENLTTFTSDLSSLTNGGSMFNYCTKLASFSSDLSKLTDGNYMFTACDKLTSFNSDLSSLTNGDHMFTKCKLDAESVMYIADTIKDIPAEKQLYINGTIPYVTLSNNVYSAPKGFMSHGDYVYTYNNPKPYIATIFAERVGKLTLGINVTNNADTVQQQLEDFAKEATFDSWADLKKHFSDKGWTVTFLYGGSLGNITYDLRNDERIIPCPIFAKLVQVEDKDFAEYCTEDASSFYNIEWGHDVTDTSSYTQFNSLEDAMASWNVFPKENIISTEEED